MTASRLWWYCGDGNTGKEGHDRPKSEEVGEEQMMSNEIKQLNEGSVVVRLRAID